jgi:hypothetical protein
VDVLKCEAPSLALNKIITHEHRLPADDFGLRRCSPAHLQTLYPIVRYNVFAAVTMSAVFWDMAPCTSCENRNFGGTVASIFMIERIGERRTAAAFG